MRKRECFESNEEYVKYLERRVRILELWLRRCRHGVDLQNSSSSVNERSNAFEMTT